MNFSPQPKGWQVTIPYVHIQSTNNIWCAINGDGEIFLAWRDTLYHLDQKGALIAATPMAATGKNCYNLCFRIRPDGTLILLTNWDAARPP